MNFEVLKRTVEYLRVNPCISDDAILYADVTKVAYPVEYRDFCNLFSDLDKLVPDDCKDCFRQGPFEEWRAYFECDGVRFIWRLLYGQGASCELHSESDDMPFRPEQAVPICWNFPEGGLIILNNKHRYQQE